MKILYVTTISLTVNTFFYPHIKMLVDDGHRVDIACNFRELALDRRYEALSCGRFQIDFSRSPLSTDNVKACKQLKEVITNGDYDIVHCHTPNASVITRLVCRRFRKKGLKVFYTAHGFHFYKGAPMKNWLVYYPVEKLCARFTDKLITINREDYELARNKFKAKEVYYAPGVGIDLSKFRNVQVDITAKRREIGVPEKAFLLLSVGELNENKNHQVIVRALAALKDSNIHYAIAGVGEEHDHLLALAKELGISEQVHLLGYRTDVAELYKIADVFCFPSKREGLGLAAIEAMSSGLPVVVADNRGTRSFVENGHNGYACRSNREEEYTKIIRKIQNCPIRAAFSARGKKTAEKFALHNVLQIMQNIYR